MKITYFILLLHAFAEASISARSRLSAAYGLHPRTNAGRPNPKASSSGQGHSGHILMPPAYRHLLATTFIPADIQRPSSSASDSSKDSPKASVKTETGASRSRLSVEIPAQSRDRAHIVSPRKDPAHITTPSNRATEKAQRVARLTSSPRPKPVRTMSSPAILLTKDQPKE